MRWFNWIRKGGTGASIQNEGLPLPPFDVLDRTYRLPEDQMDVNVIGYRYGTTILPIPYVLRCRIQRTGEIVLVDPGYLRQIATDVSPARIRNQASRRPYIPRQEEVLRIIGWRKSGSQDSDSVEVINLATFNQPDQGEGEPIQ